MIGYTLSQVRDEPGEITGATLFFKDLTRVEQLEERERLRDRLAALGEMAAAIAHEVKNPLAGIEVMAGILKRQLADSPDAQSILGDIIKEAKMANAIVLEVLEFVRPIRLQVEHISLADVIRDAISLAESHVRRAARSTSRSSAESAAAIQGDPHQLRQMFTNLLIERLRGAERRRVRDDRGDGARRRGPAGGEPQGPMVQVEVTDNGPGHAAGVLDGRSSARSSRPSRRARGWGWRSSGRSSTRTTAGIDVGVLDAAARGSGHAAGVGSHQLFG